jgi:hypothetical protein
MDMCLQDDGVAQKDGAKESREGATASAHGVLLVVGEVERLSPGESWSLPLETESGLETGHPTRLPPHNAPPIFG